MHRCVVVSLAALAVLFSTADARAQFRLFRRQAPSYESNPYRTPGYIDTSWQNNPEVYWNIHHQWPPSPYPYPYPYPSQFPYPYPVPPETNPYAPQPGSAPAPGPTITDTLPAPKDNRAVIQVILPSNAGNVWVDDQKMKDKLDTSRIFVSPPLEPGHAYVYTVKANWVHRGDNVTQARPVVVHANQVSTVDFNQPLGKDSAPASSSTPR